MSAFCLGWIILQVNSMTFTGWHENVEMDDQLKSNLPFSLTIYAGVMFE